MRHSAEPPSPPPWHAELVSAGVTGTNGKTTTTGYVAALLATLAQPVACVTTLGFFVDGQQQDLAPGYDAFIETLRRTHAGGGRYAAIELSSEALARGFARAWPCRYGVFTNMTRDHLDSHGSAEHYLASKAQLFAALPADGAAILNAADPASELLAEVLSCGVRRLKYAVPSRGSVDGSCDVLATRVDVSWGGTRISVLTSGDLGDGGVELSIRAIGEVYAENALAAYALGRMLGVSNEAATEALGRARSPAGRFEVLAERPWVVVDYAHTPDALARTLDTARALCLADVWVVFGAGGNRDRDKRPLMGAAAAVADHVILTSDNPRDEDPAEIARDIRDGMAGSRDVHLELDRLRAIEQAVLSAAPDDVVLIAGKGHETVQQTRAVTRPFSDRDVALNAHRRRG